LLKLTFNGGFDDLLSSGSIYLISKMKLPTAIAYRFITRPDNEKGSRKTGYLTTVPISITKRNKNTTYKTGL
jgi:hypothetical protein